MNRSNQNKDRPTSLLKTHFNQLTRSLLFQIQIQIQIQTRNSQLATRNSNSKSCAMLP